MCSFKHHSMGLTLKAASPSGCLDVHLLFPTSRPEHEEKCHSAGVRLEDMRQDIVTNRHSLVLQIHAFIRKK